MVELINPTVLYSRETTWGTETSNYKDIGIIDSISYSSKRNIRSIHGMGQRNTIRARSGTFDISGRISFKVCHGRIFEDILFGGTTTHDDSDAPDIEHTFTFSDFLPSNTLQISKDGTADKGHIITGVVFSDPTIKIDINGSLSVDASFLGKELKSVSTSATPIVSTLTPLVGIQCSLYSDGGTTKIGDVQNCSLSFTTNIKKKYGMGSVLPTGITNGILQTRLSASLIYNDDTELEKLLGGSTITNNEPTSINYVLKGDNGITVGSGKRAFEISITESQMGEFSIDPKMDGFATSSLSAEGKLNSMTYTDNLTSGTW